MPKPILVVKTDFAKFAADVGAKKITSTPLKFEDEIKIKPLKQLGKPMIGKVKTKKKVVKKKKVVPKEKPRESPFKISDVVWASFRSGEWIKAIVTKCVKPEADSKQWTYIVKREQNNQIDSVMETSLIPAAVFTLIATDTIKIKQVEWNEYLNAQFGGKPMILAVYRQGQKRPWAYYVIPDPDMLWKEFSFKGKHYGYIGDYKENLCVHVSDKVRLRLLPVAGVPQEILTYLGLHVYNRQWKKDDLDGEDTDGV